MSTYTPADGDAGYYLRAMVTYKDRESVRDTKTAVGVSANAVKAARSDNDAPAFTDEDEDVEDNQATREVAENTAAGEAIGDPIVADDDDGDVLTYTLEAADSPNTADVDSFAIDWATGQLKTKGKLDFEADSRSDHRRRSSKGLHRRSQGHGPGRHAWSDRDAVDSDNSDVITVTITVTDVNEAPEFDTGDAVIMFAENGTITNMLGATYMATDPEGDIPVILALTGADRGKFTFNIDNGDLTFKAQPDYEKPG